jgi:transglutaminase-like putative cysteine protease
MPAQLADNNARPCGPRKAVMTETQPDLLAPGRFIDSDALAVTAFAQAQAAEAGSELDRVLRLYHAVRDGIAYDPYVDMSDPENFRASGVLAAGRGFCVGKAALLAACCRTVGIPARVGYADVRNHMTSRRMYEHIKTDVFLWHSYADIHVGGRWVKATPAFDLALCRRVGVDPLEFDGQSDSLFQPFDPSGRRHMEYLRDRGTFPDVPFETIQADFRVAYPSLMKTRGLGGDFHAEAVAADDEPPDAKTEK